MPQELSAILEYLLSAALGTIAQIFLLLGPGLLLVALASLLSFFVATRAAGVLGEWLYLALFGRIGTPVHELGHAMFNVMFGHQIVEFQPFKVDRANGSYGQVLFRFNRHSLYQRIGLFFVGIGPILFGTLIIYLAALLLLPGEIDQTIRSMSADSQTFGSIDGFNALSNSILEASAKIVAFLFNPENISSWRFWLFVYIAFAVGSSIRLSSSDIVGARAGFAALVALLFVLNLATLWSGDIVFQAVASISRFYVFFYAIIIFVIVLNLVMAALLWPIGALLRGR
ncbi:MAG: hypothetical protein IPO81_10855 [Kouleothrix sp.]|nr:hypothetical protein [Kouleothrix sp.]